jgi:hypothetical protein
MPLETRGKMLNKPLVDMKSCRCTVLFLKPEIRRALIYYPTEPRNLEELFERTQKIDREIWGQRNNSGERRNYGYPKARHFEKDKLTKQIAMAI